MLSSRKVKAYKGGLPSFMGGMLTLQTKERRAMPMYVMYSDLIQIGILRVAIVSLIYEIYKGRKYGRVAYAYFIHSR